MDSITEQKYGPTPKRMELIRIFALGWMVMALMTLVLLPTLLNTPHPLFTFLWLFVPLIAVFRSRNPATVGFRCIPWKHFVRFSAINFLCLSILMALFEPWSHTYRTLLSQVFSASHTDITFVWINKFPGVTGLVYMFLFTGTVTLFAEELFFRGWLLQVLLKRMKPGWAIAVQSILFTIPQIIPALFMQALQAVLYVLVYSWLAIGTLGGWAAWCTKSIWPSLLSATLMNLILTALLH